jgi:hypothetical protein
MLSVLNSILSGFGVEALPQTWAYLDPGTGSMLFQVLIAGLLSAVFCVRTSYFSLRNALFKNQNKA